MKRTLIDLIGKRLVSLKTNNGNTDNRIMEESFEINFSGYVLRLEIEAPVSILEVFPSGERMWSGKNLKAFSAIRRSDDKIVGLELIFGNKDRIIFVSNNLVPFKIHVEEMVR